MSELPKGWVDVSIDDITSDVSYGVTAKSDPLEGDLQLLRITDIQGNRVDWSSVPYCNYESKYESSRLKDNDIVVARTGATVGKSFLIENAVDDSVYASYLIRLRVAEGTLPKYLAKFLHTPLYWKQISEQKAGIGQPNVNGTKLKTLRMSLAPLAEQKRIVEKLDEVLAQVDTIKARLDGIPALLKRFRQSVLASAVSGKLTEEWRELNFHVKKITIDDYLDNVTKLRKEAHKSSCLNEKRKRRYVEPDECLELVFTKLPYCWRLESLASLTYRITYGLTVRPKYTEVGTPIISAKEIRSGSIDYDSAKRFNKADFSNQREKCKIYLNDILFSKTGSIGHVALVERDVEMCSSQNIAVLSPLIEPKYLELVMRSNYIQNLAKTNVKANAIPDLQLGIMSKFPIPICVVSEQKEIVRLVEQYFAFADTIEAQVKKAQARVDNLTQSILAKAFRGELVPQDPNDEPADKLLERIAEARKEAEALAKAAKKAETARKKAEKAAAKG